MRVVGGRYRGLKLVPFEGEEVRPTADRVKESLFDILAFKVQGARVSDLFCGSGNLGIECLSRGAEEVCFNDLSRASLGILNKNLSKLKGEHKFTVTCGDYMNFLRSAVGKFDLIFIDPPYRFDYGAPALEVIARRGLLSEGGVAVYERDRPYNSPVPVGLALYDERKYGKTYLSFFRLSDTE